MKPKYLQFDCKETDKLDLRQANAILKYKPDIVILEYPNNNKTPNLLLNKYSPLKKPRKLVKEKINGLSRKIFKIHPWARADIVIWKNITKLWAQNHQIFVYKVDAPHELTNELREFWDHTYPCVKKNWIWWVKIYLRERIMANNVQWILDHYKEKQNPTVLIFLQSFHWKHVKFLLNDPSKNKIWDYYFGKFNISQHNVAERIKKLNKVFYKYWQKVSDF